MSLGGNGVPGPDATCHIIMLGFIPLYNTYSTHCCKDKHLVCIQGTKLGVILRWPHWPLTDSCRSPFRF